MVTTENAAPGMPGEGNKLATQHLEPLWLKMNTMVPPSPNPVAQAHIWKYADTLPRLVEAGRTVPAEEAERRVLMLVNPSMEAPYTTDTLYGGLQLVNPGEIAPAHRHIAFAVRFIIEGEGFTAIEGKKIPLKPGDVIVTPTWTWHDHGNDSSSRVIWMDALNLPLFRFAKVHFAELYSESRYPSKLCDPCEWSFPWAGVEASLIAQGTFHAVHQYTTKTGAALSETVGAQAERIEAGHTAAENQDQASFLYHCYKGSGRTVVTPPSGATRIFEWGPGDTFAVPAWSRVRHSNVSSSPAYLFAVHDRPLLSNLGLLKPNS